MASAEPRAPKVLSCTSCRQRKTKCDKMQPACTPCSRLGLGCVYPARKLTRRAPRPHQSELLSRISRLESIIGRAGPAKVRQLDSLDAHDAPSCDVAASAPASHTAAPAAQQAGPAARGTAARYLSDEFWSKLCDEVDGMKQALDETSDDDDQVPSEDSPAAQNGANSNEPSGFVLGNPHYGQGALNEGASQPPAQMVVRLWDIYVRNVDPLIKILHRPSLGHDIAEMIRSQPSTHLPPSRNALLTSVYYAAVSATSPAESHDKFGEDRDSLASKFRIATERALAAADYLNTHSLETLQAATIYVAILRSSSISRASWVLASTIIRIAQAMNLHRDGDGSRFPPFEAEMRRRLWHFIIALDIRGAEDRGTDAIITPASYNTAPPTSIDDDAFGPHSTAPLVPKTSGPADNVVNRCMWHCCALGYLFHPQTGAFTAPDHLPGAPLRTEPQLLRHVRVMEDEFIHGVDHANVSASYASEIARMVILKLWLMVQYPFSSQPTVPPMRVSRETVLRAAVSIMEISERMARPPFEDRFAWWTRCYVQWHPLAVTLAELCVQTEGDMVVRAWEVVDQVFPVWGETVADSSRGPLWRPIRKLHRKAKAAYAASGFGRLSLAPRENVTATASSDHPQIPDPALVNQSISSSDMAFDLPAVDFPVDPFVSIDMDPSNLFQFPSGMEFGDVNAGMGNLPFDMGAWNEFVSDTQLDYEYSPYASGGDGST